MTEREIFKGMPEFLAVARSKNFRRAGEDLGVTAVAVGAAIRQLEERLGMTLFHRTTRRVELTAAGSMLFDRMSRLTGGLQDTLTEMRDRQHTLSGQLRICVQSLALDVALAPALIAFNAAHPEVLVEVDVREGRTDLIGEGFDLGIRLGEYIEDEMIAVRISRPVDWRVVAHPDYLDAHGRPQTPGDLLGHHCIRRIWPATRRIYRWEFQVDTRPLEVDPPGVLTVASFAVAKQLVAAARGLSYLTTDMIATIPSKTETVLQSFMPPPNYLYAYFTPAERDNRRIRAFLDCMRPLMAGT